MGSSQSAPTQPPRPAAPPSQLPAGATIEELLGPHGLVFQAVTEKKKVLNGLRIIIANNNIIENTHLKFFMPELQEDKWYFLVDKNNNRLHWSKVYNWSDKVVSAGDPTTCVTNVFILAEALKRDAAAENRITLDTALFFLHQMRTDTLQKRWEDSMGDIAVFIRKC